MRSHTWAVGVLFALAATTAVRANMLTNGGLELNPAVSPSNGLSFVIADPINVSNALPGWTITTGTVDIVPSSYWQVTQGSYSVDLIGTPGLGSIRQLVGSTTSGTDYTLSFDFSLNPQTWAIDESTTTKILLVQAWNSTGTALVREQAYMLTNGTRTISSMQYTSQTFDFTANGPTLLVLSAVTPGNLTTGLSNSLVYMGPVIDNLNLDLAVGKPPLGEVVPEPASLAVLGLGGLALLRRRR